MKSINYSLLGDESVSKEFGKKGTTTDITIFDKNDICVILKPESQTIRIVGSGVII